MHILIKDHKKFKDKELTKSQREKLKGWPEPGLRVKIFWDDETWPDDLYDEGYLFGIPGYDVVEHDLFVHVPKPENPGGIDTPPDEWRHLNDLLSNEVVKRIEVVKPEETN